MGFQYHLYDYWCNCRNYSIIINSPVSIESKGQILRSTPNTAPLICGAYNTQPEGLSTMA